MRISRCEKTILRLVCSFLCGPLLHCAFASAAEQPKQPNVVVILSDDQGWRDIGYNDSDVLTPNLDKLAETGVRLDANYVYPTCSPTRVALLSGRNPSRYGILGPIAGRSSQALPTETQTLAAVLKAVGYDTAISGKWHLGLRPEVGPRQYWFDSTYGYLHGQIDPYTHIYKNGAPTWHRQDEFIKEKGHATDLITDEAVRVIERKSDRPFFLYVAYSVPHYPLDEPEEWVSKYDGRIEDPDRKLFAASLTHMDAGIGRIVEALERTGRRDNTLIVFSSDNGGQKSWGAPKSQYGGRYQPNKVLGDNRPLRGWKGDLYEGGIRVPAFVNWPGKLKPRVVKEPVSILDWYPTIAAFAGIEPEKVVRSLRDRTVGSRSDPTTLKLEGRNIAPLLTGEGSELSSERTLYWKTGRAAAVRVGPWKLLEHRRGKEASYELFHLGRDAYEKKNLAEEHPQKLENMKRELERQRQLDG